MRLSFALALFALAASPAIAAESGTQSAETAKPEKPKTICRKAKNVTGTRMTPRTCKTAEEWAADAERSNAALSNMNRGTSQ